MTTAVQHRRGTTAEHATFTGLEGEVTIDTTKDTAVIHDGVLAGGYALAKETLANVNPSTLGAITGAATASDDLFLVFDTSTLTMKKITRAELNNAMEVDALANVTITGGTINGTTIGNTAPAAGTFTQANFGDNAKAIFGTGSDLQIYHTGSHSWVQDAGTGNLYVAGDHLWLTNSDNTKQFLKGDSTGRVDLYYNTSVKLATTSTGIDVTGEVVVDTTAGDLTIGAFGGGSVEVASTGAYKHSSNLSSGYHLFEVNSLAVAKFNNGGDISFYEDTGTTAKFFWDASAERLGLGTAAPDYKLEIVDGTSRFYYDFTTFGIITNTTGGYGRYLKIWNSNATGDGEAVGLGNLSGRLVFGTGFTGATQDPSDGEAMTILADGSVGIGTSAPAYPLEVFYGTGNQAVAHFSGNPAYTGRGLEIGTFAQGVADGGAYLDAPATTYGTLAFKTIGVERLRLDSAGNLGLGVTPESDWYTANWVAFQIGKSASLASWNGGTTLDRVFLSSNAKNTSTSQLTSWDYINSLPASQYAQLEGKHEWRIAPTGTADADITWTQAMILGASGALFVGGTNTVSAHGLDDTGGSLFLQSQTDNANIGLSIYANEGTNNRRAAFFLDDSLGVYGVESTATTGVPDFVIRRSGNEFARFTADGLTFNGDTAAANALDDYEEGTWTPVIADATSGGNTGTATISYATYTKIGNQVTVTATLNNINTTGLTSANAFYVRALPFTSGTQQCVGAIRTDLITFQGGRTMVTPNVGPADSWISFLFSGSGVVDTPMDCGDLTSGTADMAFTITYFT